jgi:hypothetical protein
MPTPDLCASRCRLTLLSLLCFQMAASMESERRKYAAELLSAVFNSGHLNCLKRPTISLIIDYCPVPWDVRIDWLKPLLAAVPLCVETEAKRPHTLLTQRFSWMQRSRRAKLAGATTAGATGAGAGAGGGAVARGGTSSATFDSFELSDSDLSLFRTHFAAADVRAKSSALIDAFRSRLRGYWRAAVSAAPAAALTAVKGAGAKAVVHEFVIDSLCAGVRSLIDECGAGLVLATVPVDMPPADALAIAHESDAKRPAASNGQTNGHATATADPATAPKGEAEPAAETFAVIGMNDTGDRAELLLRFEREWR